MNKDREIPKRSLLSIFRHKIDAHPSINIKFAIENVMDIAKPPGPEKQNWKHVAARLEIL